MTVIIVSCDMILFKVFPTPEDLAKAAAEEFASEIQKRSGRKSGFTAAISGGNTPRLLFSVLAEKYSDRIKWTNVNLFWVDERCVGPGDPESNFGMTEKALLRKVGIPPGNVFRMIGEADPQQEAVRYSEVISSSVRRRKGLPCFDLILLGMGEDGHTASIFPGNDNLMSSDKLCETAVHPVTKQKRITLTGKVINNAKSVFFLVTGKNKAGIVEEIFRNNAGVQKYPAAQIKPVSGNTTWLLDSEAGMSVF
jgi:6-phosphogluconolactonase